ncbi:hypothetical protein [Aliirhizobium terrae]|uniref:hypothetical protein n=1 Tax=Terrirhizobium terrae TaxID=2926709 RepID=UPI00336A3BAD
MTIAVRPLMSTTAQRDELIAHIDERHRDTARIVFMAASKVGGENTSVEMQRLLDIPDFERVIAITRSRLDTARL